MIGRGTKAGRSILGDGVPIDLRVVQEFCGGFMFCSSKKVLVAAIATVLVILAGMARASAGVAERREIEEFNQRFREATLKMDNAGTMALWAEDGVSLLPGMAPMVGRKTIGDWLNDLVTKMPGYRVTKQENEFHDLQISGAWASEWGTTYQVVQPPDGKPPIENHGKILLVLHKEKDGAWRIKQEMWNAAESVK